MSIYTRSRESYLEQTLKKGFSCLLYMCMMSCLNLILTTICASVVSFDICTLLDIIFLNVGTAATVAAIKHQNVLH